MDEDDHIRQRLIEAVTAKLASDCDIVGGRVWIAPAAPAGPEDVPFLLVFQGDEQVEMQTAAGRVLRRLQIVEIVVGVSLTRGAEPSALFRSVNRISVQVERSILSPLAGGGLGVGESDVVYLGASHPVQSVIGDDIAEMTLKFGVELPTLEGDPTRTINEIED